MKMKYVQNFANKRCSKQLDKNERKEYNNKRTVS